VHPADLSLFCRFTPLFFFPDVTLFSHSCIQCGVLFFEGRILMMCYLPLQLAVFCLRLFALERSLVFFWTRCSLLFPYSFCFLFMIVALFLHLRLLSACLGEDPSIWTRPFFSLPCFDLHNSSFFAVIPGRPYSSNLMCVFLRPRDCLDFFQSHRA